MLPEKKNFIILINCFSLFEIESRPGSSCYCCTLTLKVPCVRMSIKSSVGTLLCSL